ncbi:alcohol oxidase [Fomitiporia mediterranea MF3/22]|uniref:alcohol oxidase n=1 Tax=Fomitiporia mediterranea (strain MF3/22) TaxID=694068 RepID=UPI00044080F6|nr:alcohol oxidase [Fomitiporia mediterranea MF3/22]EJD00208.1 alcohol oxidase [Fomitiporia mediterranea MF3/22]
MFILQTLLLFAGSASATVITADRSVAVNKTFDYVVVGGGLAGLNVGNKLSGEGFSVLIIEAGPDAQNVSAIFNAEESGNLNGFCNWKYPVYDEVQIPLSWTADSGACIGGSTSINGMVWYRPTKAEIDALEILGNPGWNWDALEPHMAAIERNIPPDGSQIADGAAFDPRVHGFSGPVNTSFPTPMRIPEAQRLYKEAFPLIFPGLTVGDDLSNRTSVVSASTSWTIWFDASTSKNRRSSAAFALLYAPTQQRDSLTVLAEHKVAKVLFEEGDEPRANGVQFGNASDGTLHDVFARKEVILAAGSFGSAPILERSGIGNSSILEEIGVEQLVNLPGVGVNLNDQPGTESSALVSSSFQNDTGLIDGRSLFAPIISLVNIDELFSSNSLQIAKDLYDGVGARASDLVAAGAAASLSSAMAVLSVATTLVVQNRLPVAETIGESFSQMLANAFWPLTPLSRGHVHINTTNPFADPIIVPRFLTDTFDQQVATTIARRSRALFTSDPFSTIVADAFANPSNVGPNATDSEYLEWFRNTSFGASHWIGTTAMMPRLLGGVVDSRLRVHGTKNLRVVDAGILPFQLTSHLMSAVYAVSGRAASIILEDA